MSNLTPMSDLVADDLLLDRLGARLDGGSDPVADLLGALARHADGPLPSRTPRRRAARKHRYLGVFVAIAVGASGAGVAAAVSLPDSAPARVERAPVEHPKGQPAPSGAPGGIPSAPLTRLGLPLANASSTAQGLVLARRADGTIVLVPAAVAAAATSVERRAATGSSVSGGGRSVADAKAATGAKGDKNAKGGSAVVTAPTSTTGASTVGAGTTGAGTADAGTRGGGTADARARQSGPRSGTTSTNALKVGQSKSDTKAGTKSDTKTGTNSDTKNVTMAGTSGSGAGTSPTSSAPARPSGSSTPQAARGAAAGVLPTP